MTQNPRNECLQHDISLADSQDADAENCADRGPTDRTPERRCILTRRSQPRERLIRLVAGPDGAPAIDLAAKLPGRGAWISADRALLADALDKGKLTGLLSRALKTPVKRPSDDFLALLEALLERRALDRLGLENRAAHVLTGYDKISKAGIGAHDLLLVASDGAEDSLRKMRAQAGDTTKISRLFDRQALSQALGKDNAVHVLVTAGRGLNTLLVDLERLAGIKATEPWMMAR